MFRRANKENNPANMKEMVLAQMESYSQEKNKRPGWRGKDENGIENNEKVEEVMV